ncbi:MAG: hypothetical protein QM710_14590 [Flavobacterium sp.]
MSKKIKIGADELILWLRKNKKAQDIPNDEIHGLGIKIYNLILELGGKKTDENFPSHWANLMEDKNVEKFNLPKTSSQYEIETQKLGQLYERLSSW